MTAERARADDATAGADLLPLRVWLHLMKCSRAIEGEVASRMRREFGQSLGRFDVLSQIYRFGGAWVTVGEVARLVLAASGNITATLDRMASEGLIERRASPFDRRSFQVRMTRAGRDLFDAMAGAHARWIGEAWTDVGDDDKRALIALLTRLRRTTEGEGEGLRGTAA